MKEAEDVTQIFASSEAADVQALIPDAWTGTIETTASRVRNFSVIPSGLSGAFCTRVDPRYLWRPCSTQRLNPHSRKLKRGLKSP
jgi:hypothetical protein